MAFQIEAHGSRQGVLKHIAEFTPDEKAPERLSVEPFKEFLISEIKAMPPEFNGCKVSAVYQVGPGLRNVQINVIPTKLHL